ncbi:hypothetical protein [Variovorax sp. LjRoot84]|uniref:hypothetical protein n=1 Tax=Variovorax sp. LjRoot84 TaxID=3342340 RepID=UPI003F51A11B
MIKSVSVLLALTTTTAFLSACAAVPDEWRRYGAGWRTGYVIETAPAAAITGQVDSDCRLDAQIHAGPGQRFAVVLWATHTGLFKERIAPVAADSPVAKDDWVRVNIERCDTPVVRSHRDP